MKVILVVDDQRNIDQFERLHSGDIVFLARTYKEAIQKLKNVTINYLYLDYDLGCFDENKKEWTGYDVLVYINEKLPYTPQTIIPITSNPAGRQRIIALLKEMDTNNAHKN